MHINTGWDEPPQVILGGKAWPVPLLAARQNRRIDPLILSLLPVFAAWRPGEVESFTGLSAAHYEALLEIAYVALTRAVPALTREEFLEYPVTLPELIVAFNIIARQTGIFVETGGDKDPLGEARAGKRLTGTPSSLTSAI